MEVENQSLFIHDYRGQPYKDTDRNYTFLVKQREPEEGWDIKKRIGILHPFPMTDKVFQVLIRP